MGSPEAYTEQVKSPKGKILIPGVISHTTNLVAHPELVAARIMRFAALVGRENVIAGADCGFAASAASRSAPASETSFVCVLVISGPSRRTSPQ
jgi:methionine synthase II (cobalamin-independent)